MNEEPDLNLMLDKLKKLRRGQQTQIMLTALRKLASKCDSDWAVSGPEIAELLKAAAGGKL